jgi:HEAT repeats
LIDLLDDKNLEVRKNAALQIGMKGSLASYDEIKALKEVLRKPCEAQKVRRAAVQAPGQIGPKADERDRATSLLDTIIRNNEGPEIVEDAKEAREKIHWVKNG